jgi:hypothetical protein
MAGMRRKLRAGWRLKRVRVPVYVLLVLTVVYTTFRVAWQPPNDDGPLPTLGGITEVSRIEPLYSRVASRLAGHPAEVRCWSAADWSKRGEEVTGWTDGHARLGHWSAYVSIDRERMNVSPSVCAALGQWVYARRWPANRYDGYYFAWSVKLLAHEVQHLRGVKDEATANCYGLQSIRATAAALGLDDEKARFLADYAWRHIYPDESRRYRSEECRDGGKLDLHPQSSAWP